MSTFIKRRLQVFISSTYKDLEKERQAAVEAVLKAGHIPAGMELFSAGDESQLQLIKNWIDDSDVFLLILGGRYGSIEPTTGKSYIHLEYEYAKEKNIPLFACVMDESVEDERLKSLGKTALERDNLSKYQDFKALVTSKIIEPWKELKDIKLCILNKLAEFDRNPDLVGWVRADSQLDATSMSNEMTALMKENRELRTQLASGNDGGTILGMTLDEWAAILHHASLLDQFSSGKGLSLEDFDEKQKRSLMTYNLFTPLSMKAPSTLVLEARVLATKLFARRLIKESHVLAGLKSAAELSCP
ncbi:MAG: DUF4062 domain-containing protein [Verrucomicrobiales bacterium]|nr:DUF4062 domain-containing protein [Verrucomicrobiales bacterium]